MRSARMWAVVGALLLAVCVLLASWLGAGRAAEAPVPAGAMDSREPTGAASSGVGDQANATAGPAALSLATVSFPPSPEQIASYEASKQRLLPLLAVGSPRERLAALMLQGGLPDGARNAQLMALLLGGGGAEPAVALQGLVACERWPACPREQVLAATAALAAEDAHLQLLRLRLSAPDAQEAAWVAAVQAPYYADAFESQLQVLMDATAPLASNPAHDMLRTVEAFALTSGAGMYDVDTIRQRCPAAIQVTERVRQCRQLLQRMADSPTHASASVGMAILLRQALSPAEAGLWRQRLRQLYWQAALAAPRGDAEPGYAQQVAGLGERNAYVWLLRRHGLPLSPPPHWQPGQPTGY